MLDFELESKEKEYFKFILISLKQECESIIKGLNDVNVNKEAVDLFFYHFFKPIFKYPISLLPDISLNFELPDAFIHVEIKTALIDNPADYKGKINIGINQTSYGVNKIFSPNLPQYYHTSPEIERPCLTYIIQIVHEHAKPNIKALKLVCIPNGQLYSHYGKSIFKSGKGGYAKAKDFRYNYSAEPYFKLFRQLADKEKMFRIELIYLAKGLNA
ncbi:MAG: hypothetical protein P9L89_01615 [Candidatus Celaenobacter polaris]|nr:hypothetical protein [Candidatus Celaenobacter polaris]